MYKKWFSQTEINEFRDTVLKYKEKFGLNNEQALDEMTALGDLGTVDEVIKEKNEAFELLFKRDAEYKVDLENAEKEKAAIKEHPEYVALQKELETLKSIAQREKVKKLPERINDAETEELYSVLKFLCYCCL